MKLRSKVSIFYYKNGFFFIFLKNKIFYEKDNYSEHSYEIWNEKKRKFKCYLSIKNAPI